MRSSIRGKVLLVGACMMAGLAAWGQQAPSTVAKKGINFDFAVNYSAEKAEQAPNYCGCFWMQGGSTDISTILWKGLGVAVAFNGDTASAINTGVDLTKIEGLAGPRYTTRLGHVGGSKHPVRVFGEGLATLHMYSSQSVPSGTRISIQSVRSSRMPPCQVSRKPRMSR